MVTATNAVRVVPWHGGREAFIDASDWDRSFEYSHHGKTFVFRICDLSWHCDAGGRKNRVRHTTYARSSVRRDGRKFSFRMHTLIMGKQDGFVIDHVDANGLNNTRSNLERVQHCENIRRGYACARARNPTTSHATPAMAH